MAHVGGEYGQLGAQIDTFTVPLHQTMNREGVTQVMESWPMTSSPVRNATRP